MATEYTRKPKLSWRWYAASALFLLAFGGLALGVSLSERPDVVASSLLTKAYYSLGLFVVGGLDLGVPMGGPEIGRVMLWVAYFGAPMLAASAVIEAVLRVMAPQRWQLRRLAGHVVVVGAGALTVSYLRVLRRHSPNVRVVVVDPIANPVRDQDLEQTFGATLVIGDITHEYLLRELRLGSASRVVLLADDNFLCYEAATKILAMFPALESRIVLHCHNLRFLRAMEGTALASRCETFNCYHLAATGLVRDRLIKQFKRTSGRDVVVVAGFGRFGQTILEELENYARNEIDRVAIIDIDADRRLLVAEEQKRMRADFRREVFQGNISHPEVWRQLAATIDLAENEPTVILGTGRVEDNLRTALWLKRRYPNARVFARTNDISQFATEVSAEHGINSISITELVEDNIPEAWVA